MHSARDCNGEGRWKGVEEFFLVKRLFSISWGFCRDNNLHLGKRKITLVHLRGLYEQSLTLKEVVEGWDTKSKVQLRSKVGAGSYLSAKESLGLLFCLSETELACARLQWPGNAWQGKLKQQQGATEGCKCLSICNFRPLFWPFAPDWEPQLTVSKEGGLVSCT